MKRRTVRAGDHLIEAEASAKGWEITVRPYHAPVKVERMEIVDTYQAMLAWMDTESGEYIKKAMAS